LLFLGYNFPNNNARKPIKGSKDADFRLVYLKKKEKEITPCVFYRPRWRHPKIPWSHPLFSPK